MVNGDNVCAIINARHGNVYAQIKHNGELLEADCYEINEVVSKLKGFSEKFTIVGDATIEFQDFLNENLNCEIFEKKIELSSDIGRFALNKYFQDESIAKIPHEILPIYLRKAQPEREV